MQNQAVRSRRWGTMCLLAGSAVFLLMRPAIKKTTTFTAVLKEPKNRKLVMGGIVAVAVAIAAIGWGLSGGDDDSPSQNGKNNQAKTNNQPESKLPPLAVAPFDATTARKHQQAWADHLGLPVEKEVDLGGDVKLTMVLIPPGEFLMGLSEDEQVHFLNEAQAADDQWSADRIPSGGPQHRVQITQPFYLGKFEFMQSQWSTTMGDSPSFFKDNPSHPVEQVSWTDIQKLLIKLNRNPSPAMTFALPTEAQWEYACRAGSTEYWHSGNDDTSLREFAWFLLDAVESSKTHPVGQLKPNGFGLHDMHGNIREWCADRFDMDYYANSPTVDPGGALIGFRHIYRGGCWAHFSTSCLSAFRSHGESTGRYDSLGFRLAMTIDAAKLKPSQTAGKNHALSFDGKDDYVEIPTLKYDFVKPFTVEVLFKPKDEKPVENGKTPNFDPVFSSAKVYPDTDSWHSIIYDRPRPELWTAQFTRGEESFQQAFFNKNLSDKRHCLASVWDGQTLRLFLDGHLMAQGSRVPNPTLPDRKASKHPALIGRAYSDFASKNGEYRHFYGTIGEIRVSKLARYKVDYSGDFNVQNPFSSDSDTLALYHFDTGSGDVLKDSSGNGHHGKIHGATWVNADGSPTDAVGNK
jgi:formylglycine-generating enzyme required for sulfatase activity